MLDFGFSEILLTSAIALVVLGPERLPKAARTVGNWMGRARVMARQLSEQLEREVTAEELLREQMKSPLPRDQPALIAPASASTPPPLASTAGAPAGAQGATPPGEPAAAPPRLEDGHATTAAAMHAPMPSATGGSDPHTTHP